MANIPEVTDESYQQKVVEASRLVLLDFTAAWCGPCKAMAPAVADIAQEYADEVDVYALDIDNSPETAKLHGVRGVPTFMLLREGKVVNQVSGGMSRSKLASLIETALQA